MGNKKKKNKKNQNGSKAQNNETSVKKFSLWKIIVGISVILGIIVSLLTIEQHCCPPPPTTSPTPTPTVTPVPSPTSTSTRTGYPPTPTATLTSTQVPTDTMPPTPTIRKLVLSVTYKPWNESAKTPIRFKVLIGTTMFEEERFVITAEDNTFIIETTELEANKLDITMMDCVIKDCKRRGDIFYEKCKITIY